MTPIVWTADLRDACRAVADDHTAHPYGHENTALDVRSRAREFVNGARPGMILSPAQTEYFVCLYQRLDDGSKARASHVALRDAYRNA
jgi:hypothetical protein